MGLYCPRWNLPFHGVCAQMFLRTHEHGQHRSRAAGNLTLSVFALRAKFLRGVAESGAKVGMSGATVDKKVYAANRGLGHERTASPASRE